MLSFIQSSIRVLIACFAVLAMAGVANAVFTADDGPLTEEQLIQMSTGPLKPYPEEIKKYVNKRGVSFFPTSTTLKWLEKGGVPSDVIGAIRTKVASQIRIKVCRFTCDDLSLSNKLAEAMVRSLTEAKVNYVDPFGSIPLDNVLCSPQGGFESNDKPKPNTFYILLQGWIRKTPSGYSLDTQVIYQDPSGKLHPLPDAEGAPKKLTMDALDGTAQQVVSWGFETARKYAGT